MASFSSSMANAVGASESMAPEKQKKTGKGLLIAGVVLLGLALIGLILLIAVPNGVAKYIGFSVMLPGFIAGIPLTISGGVMFGRGKKRMKDGNGGAVGGAADGASTYMGKQYSKQPSKEEAPAAPTQQKKKFDPYNK